MLFIQRLSLDAVTQRLLDELHDKIESNVKPTPTWKSFSRTDSQAHQRGVPSVRGTLQHMFEGRCAYCERQGADKIEHHWPKSPHRHNQKLGSPSQMFVWENLLLACDACNGFGCKGAHMEVDEDGKSLLLDPTKPDHDPYQHFNIAITPSPAFAMGWMDISASSTRKVHAAYTIKRLKLNEREELKTARRNVIRQTLIFTKAAHRYGWQFQLDSGETILGALEDILGPKASHLGACKQVLHQCRFNSGQSYYEWLVTQPETASLNLKRLALLT